MGTFGLRGGLGLRGLKALEKSIKYADSINSKLILANDPDADRLAVAEKIRSQWRVFSGNETAALVGYWSLMKVKMNPKIELKKCLMFGRTS